MLGVDTSRALRRRADRQAGGRGRGRGGCSSASSGRTHEVVSGLCLRTPAWEELARETTRVTFRTLTPRELAHHLASGEWEGRAGAYAIQGLGASLVERIEGDYLNVVGLPGARCSCGCSPSGFPGAYGFGYGLRRRAARRRRRRGSSRRPRRPATCSASSRPASSVAITIDDERTASTGAAGPWRSASSPSANEPTFASAGEPRSPGRAPPDRPRGRRAAGRRGTARRARARSRSARRRAGCRRGRRACTRRSRRRSSPRRAARARRRGRPGSLTSTTPTRHDEHAGRLGHADAPCPSSATDGDQRRAPARGRASADRRTRARSSGRRTRAPTT